MRKSCKGCIYHRLICYETYGCHYMIDTGELRNCHPAKCDKKKVGNYDNKEMGWPYF